MSRPTKRWAWKPNHKRPCHKQYWYAPSGSWYHMRQHWSRHRMQEAKALRWVVDDPDSDVPFPCHHHHGLARMWW
ncbi:MAG TPA: hypothetical protein VF629_19590 [Hymenobacter sp.]|uniref:hypothetical protein n=1 Tax=Hymenobacter sp. TaxID=1898978 RepID=UPI002ED80A70